MSAVTVSEPGSARAAGSVERRPGVGRLIAVELRKMIDTRAGFWLPLGVGAITVAAALLVTFAQPAHSHTFRHTLYVVVQPSALLLPVMGVLLVTGEWSQRTALTTFALVPRRTRVLTAKLMACVVVSVAALLVALVVSAIAEAVSPGNASGAWSLAPAMIPQAILYLATAMIIGAAFGAAILVSAPAIVAFLLLPTVWNVLLENIHGLRHVATWSDTARSLAPLARHPLSAADWAHASTTLLVWMVVPLLVGCWRLAHRDVG